MTRTRRLLRCALASLAVLLLGAAALSLYLAQRFVHPPKRQAFVNGQVLRMVAHNALAQAILDGHVEATESPRLHWGAFKAVLDGSFQGYTGALSRPYFKAPNAGFRGQRAWNEREFRATSSGIELGPYERIDAMTALRSLTIDAACSRPSRKKTWERLR